MTEPNEIFIAYELWHVEEARSYAALGTTVVCLDFFVEQELKKKNIPYVSLREFVDSETGEEEWWLLAQTIAREWYRLPAMKFFEHDGIRLGEVIEPIMEQYLSKLFYYVRIYTALKKMYPGASLFVPVLFVKNEPMNVCLTSFEQRITIDAARIAGLSATVLGKTVTSHTRPFHVTALKPLLVRIYNMLIGFVSHLHVGRADHRLKIYAGEYWSHIAPVMEKMDNVEIVLMESGALNQTSFRQLLKHRIRVRNPSNEIRGAYKYAAIKISKEFLEQWNDAQKEIMEYMNSLRRGLDWSPVLEACEYLMTYSQHVIADINATRCIMEEEKPDVLIQSASVSSRHHHFFTMARVATQLNVPSIELQHGIAYLDPRSVYSHIETDYFASYGTDVNNWHERIGNERSRLIAVGSPRFDRCINSRSQLLEKGKRIYQQLGIDTKRPVLLAAVPEFYASVFWFDSYQFAEFFEAIHAVQSKNPGLQVLFKCRNQRYVNVFNEYFKKLFSHNSFVVGNGDLFALISASDAVVCGNSTVLYEAILAKRPLVLYPWKDFDVYNSRIYKKAIPLAHNKEDLVNILVHIFTNASYSNELLAQQKKFLMRHSFDGESSKRVADLLLRLSKQG